jgi:ketosteroid isomerase-like protein
MAQGNVEVVEEAWAEFRRTARTGSRKGFHPNLEWHLDSGHPDQRVLRGITEVTDYFRGWDLSFDAMRIEVEEYLDRGEYVVTPFVLYARPRGSSAELELAETWTFKVRDGLVVEVREYLSTEAALASLQTG